MSLFDDIAPSQPRKDWKEGHDHALLTLDLEDDGSIMVKHPVDGCAACAAQKVVHVCTGLCATVWKDGAWVCTGRHA